MEEGQVYTVHGVCNGGFEMPLMFAIMTRKREEDFRVVFEKLKEKINAAMPESGEQQLKFVVDFDLAAITAAAQVFPRCSIEGCSWHLSQVWVRKRNTLGLLRFLKGENQIETSLKMVKNTERVAIFAKKLFQPRPLLGSTTGWTAPSSF
ncbi:unnamed protein product [Cylicocyclus nassatus]|uniref:MULE transposase domain-containing protein n=1 Tax=Cylicocyclus nassatus TaxID=53992 RepID=A0AA36M1D9_CYLNA|nr:unnamed protein product [Cylicocyclus nassatus]